MIPVKTQPKFRCEFCKKQAIKAAMEKHEKTCYYNPNRVCKRCDNTGVEFFMNGSPDGENYWQDERPCSACAIVQEIKDGGRLKEKVEESDIKPEDIPF